MDRDTQLKRLTVLYWLGVEDPDAASAWAEQEVSSNPDAHPLVTEVFAGRMDIGHLLQEIASQQFGFHPSSEDGEFYARLILISYLRRFVAREISPYELCAIVLAIDNKYLDIRPLDDPAIAYYPEWLGDLLNACDWCDETWTHASAGHLVTEAHVVLDALTGDLGEQAQGG